MLKGVSMLNDRKRRNEIPLTWRKKNEIPLNWRNFFIYVVMILFLMVLLSYALREIATTKPTSVAPAPTMTPTPVPIAEPNTKPAQTPENLGSCMATKKPTPKTAKMEDRKETTCIIVHHSATENGNVEIFRREHKERIDKNGQKWPDIGYHFVITNGNDGPDGEIQKGRDIRKQGAHAKGRNADSVGICLVGKDQFTNKQKKALIQLLADLCQKYKIEPSSKTIQRHHEECPGQGLNLSGIIKKVRQKLCRKVELFLCFMILRIGTFQLNSCQ